MSGLFNNLAKFIARNDIDVKVHVRPPPPQLNSSFPPPYNPSYPPQPSYPGPPRGYSPPNARPSSPAYPPGSYPGSSYPARPAESVFPGRVNSYPQPYPSGPYPGSPYPPSPAQSVYPAVPKIAGYDDDVGWVPPSMGNEGLHYVHESDGRVPPGAVVAGQDQDGGPIYVGRAFHEKDLLPAKICPSHGCAFVSYDGREITKLHYEVLCTSRHAWTTSHGSQIHPQAIRVGTTEDGEPLYVGRVFIQGTMTPGKVHPSHGVLYIPFGGQEISFTDYEILILN